MPCYGSVHPKVYQSHLNAMGHIARLGLEIVPMFSSITNKLGLARASNVIVEEALAVKADYIFWTEMDMVLPADVIPRLFDRKKDVCSGLYFLRGTNEKPEPCAYFKLQGAGAMKFGYAPIAVVPDNTLLRVDACGMGCVLFKREIFEKIAPPYFDDRQSEVGQDMYFYYKLWKAGVEVWLDSSVKCDQIDEGNPTEIGWRDWQAFVKRHGQTNGFIAKADGAYPKIEVPAS